MALQRAVPDEVVRQLGACELRSCGPVDEGDELVLIVCMIENAPITKHETIGGLHRDFRRPITVEIENSQPIPVAVAHGGSAALDVVLIHAQRPCIKPPKKPAVERIGIHDGRRCADPIDDDVVLAIAVEIAHPSQVNEGSCTRRLERNCAVRLGRVGRYAARCSLD
jgi:hypothetical protein